MLSYYVNILLELIKNSLGGIDVKSSAMINTLFNVSLTSDLLNLFAI